jgi:hypothetical protein
LPWSPPQEEDKIQSLGNIRNLVIDEALELKMRLATQIQPGDASVGKKWNIYCAGENCCCCDREGAVAIQNLNLHLEKRVIQIQQE